ncbi:MAG: HEAT repeat domain-containing protein [Anaerolineae bacterium]
MVVQSGMFEALSSTDQQEFRRARAAIISCGRAAIPGLARAARTTTSDRDLWRILATLSEIGGPDAVPTMIGCLRSPNSAIGALAAQFLSESRDTRAVDPLLDVLRETNPHTPIWVIDALGKLGDQRAVEPLIQLVESTDSALHRYTAIEALGRLGNRIALETIIRHADDEDHHVRDRARIAIDRLTHRDAVA